MFDIASKMTRDVMNHFWGMTADITSFSLMVSANILYL